MSETMARLVLAGGLFDNGQVWVIVFIAIASAVGGLLKKKKQQGPQRDSVGGVKRPTGRPPTLPRPPAPPRAPQAPVPTGRPVRPRPVVPPARGEAPRPVSRVPAEWRVPAEPSRVEEMRAAIREQTRALQAARPVEARAMPREPIARRQRRSVVRVRIDRLLQDRSGLQAAFVLSEILSPPLALRQEHPK